MKKIIALLLVIFLVGLMLTGCSKEISEDDDSVEEPVVQEPEDVSEYEVELVAEDEVDIGEMV